MVLTLIHCGLPPHDTPMDGEYVAKIFPSCAVFVTNQPLIGSMRSRVALLYGGAMNVSSFGVGGVVTVKNGEITCRW